jgi:hypothetical protein
MSRLWPLGWAAAILATPLALCTTVKMPWRAGSLTADREDKLKKDDFSGNMRNCGRVFLW